MSCRGGHDDAFARLDAPLADLGPGCGDGRARDVTGVLSDGVFFALPASPWQRGSNENVNGLLRQYFPKSTDLAIHNVDDLRAVEDRLNNRPRKRHGWRTPAEIYAQHVQDSRPTVATTG